MVPYEAYRAEKPVVTTADAGWVTVAVQDRRTGLVTEPRAAAIAEACGWLREHVDEAKAYGRAGREVSERITWDHVVERLLS
jgi:glycosyltransferase involved in cell wall biosynthesis